MTFKRSTLRYGETPEPVTPYQKAAQVWDERIGSARVQAHNWRLMALGSLGLSLILAAILLWVGRSGSTVPYIVEVDPKGGARAVGPALEAYRPSDAQIAFHLARFVDNVRSLSSDPVVVRQNWLKAYDFVTDKAAVTLNEYARENDPFAKVGRETVSVEVSSVVRASESSFQVRWVERTFEGGALNYTRRLTGLFSLILTPPRTVEAVRKNPLGIYVHIQLVAGRDHRHGRRQMILHRGLGTTVAVALTVAACATTVRVPEIPILDNMPFKAAIREPDPKPPVKIVEVPKPLPLPGQLKPVPDKKEKPKDEKEPRERVADANADARFEPAKDGYINAIQVYPYTKGALYQLYAAPAQVTDIALEPGEKLVSVSAGDTVRWVVGDTTSGEGKDAIVHILVKPIGADLQTNLVIATDRRTYHLEMHASTSTYMASVSWTYPASELLALKKQRAESDVTGGVVADVGINIEQLKFRYRIEGDAPWRPLRVFDDGAKVYIQFPSGLAQSEAPPLFVIGPDAKPALVNYRVRGTTYIVDRLFAAAELRLGTAPQRVVRIVRTDAVWRESKQ
jgi:type IV secretion system protein VirB9